MADTITLQELAQDALELSGRAGTTSDAQVIRAINRAIRWVWLQLSSGLDGFAIHETEILTAATGDRVSIVAGQGGDNRPDGTPTLPIVRGVHRVRGLYRPTSPSDDDRFPATWITSTSYYDSVAPRLDDRIGARPGYYWAELLEDGSIDVVVLRPPLQGVERIRLVYTPVTPVLVAQSDVLVRLDNADDAIVHMAGYYLLRAQDQARAASLKVDAARITQESILAYKGKRPAGGLRPVLAYARSRWSGGARQRG